MQTQGIEQQIKIFEKRHFSYLLIALVGLILMSLFINRIFMTSMAGQTARLINRLSNITDFREISVTLQDAHLTYFSSIEYQSGKFNSTYNFPVQLEKADNFSVWRKILFEKVEVVSLQKAEFPQLRDVFIFEYQRFRLIYYAIGIWVVLVAVSIPPARVLKNKILAQYSSELALQTKIIENEKLAENRRIYSDLAKQVAHDIRSPLSALTMMAGMLDELPVEKRDMIQLATKRIKSIVNDLSEKKYDLSLKDDLGQIIDGIIKEKRIEYGFPSGVTLSWNNQGESLKEIKVSSQELTRVLSNLINNSFEAVDKNSGRIEVITRDVSVDSIRYVEIEIIDNGKGIPKSILEQLGTRGVSYGKDGIQSGSGLGIYHAKQTVISYGGKIEIKSQLGVGTSVKIYFPAQMT